MQAREAWGYLKASLSITPNGVVFPFLFVVHAGKRPLLPMYPEQVPGEVSIQLNICCCLALSMLSDLSCAEGSCSSLNVFSP